MTIEIINLGGIYMYEGYQTALYPSYMNTTYLPNQNTTYPFTMNTYDKPPVMPTWVGPSIYTTQAFNNNSGQYSLPYSPYNPYASQQNPYNTQQSQYNMQQNPYNTQQNPYYQQYSAPQSNQYGYFPNTNQALSYPVFGGQLNLSNPVPNSNTPTSSNDSTLISGLMKNLMGLMSKLSNFLSGK
jgi:hypothetical protein